MKNRILSLGMTVCMLATAMPAAVLAEAQDSTSCTCEEACTSESKDETCVVCSAEGASEKDCGKYLGGAFPQKEQRMEMQIIIPRETHLLPRQISPLQIPPLQRIPMKIHL